MSVKTVKLCPPPLETVHLQTELGVIEPSSLKYLRETKRDTPIDEIRRRYYEDGYVFIKGLMPRRDILNFRRLFFEYIASTGVVVEGNEEEGIFPLDKAVSDYAHPSDTTKKSACEDQRSDLWGKIDDAHALPEYLELNKHPVLLNFIKTFTEWESPVLYKRSVLRPYFPGGGMTPPHYDQLFLRGGDPGFLTAWLPLGDIELRGGGLIYLENSMPIGIKMEENWAKEADILPPEEKVSAYNKIMTDGARCAKDASELSDSTQRKWMVTNYKAGDVIFHQSFMIHGSSQNQDPNNRIRLGTDIRYTDGKKKIDQRWMNDYFKSGDGL
jgi:phytanoyl-CoA hydroxylase